MGRAINTDNKIDSIERRLKLVEDALEEMVHTRVHHIDLHDTDKEEFTPPAGKRKKTTKVEKRSTEKSSAEA